MATAHQLVRYRKILHTMRADLDDRVSSLRDEACHGAGGEDAGGLSNAPIQPGDLGSQEAAAVVNVGLGVAKGDRVYVLAGRIPELYIAALGTLKNRSIFCRSSRPLAPSRFERA